MVLARLAHEYVSKDETIDLINVCFAVGHQSPDRLAALAGLKVRLYDAVTLFIHVKTLFSTHGALRRSCDIVVQVGAGSFFLWMKPTKLLLLLLLEFLLYFILKRRIWTLISGQRYGLSVGELALSVSTMTAKAAQK